MPNERLKKTKIKKPILRRMLIILFVAMFSQFFLSLGLNLFGYYLDVTQSINKGIENKLDKLKHSMERIISLGIPVNEIPQLNQELEKEIRGDFLQFIAVIDTSNTVMYHSDPIFMNKKLPLKQSALETGKEITALIFPYNYVNIVFKPVFDAKNNKAGYILAAYQAEYIYKKVFLVFLRMSFSSALAGFLGLFLIFYFYRRQIEKPMNALLVNVEKVGDGYFDAIETPHGESDNEFNKISLAINKMSKELNSAFAEKAALLEQLRNEEEKLRKIIEKTEIGIVAIKDEKIVFVNPGFQKAFGLELKTPIIGKNIFDFFVETETPFYKDIFNEVVKTGKKQVFDLVKLLDGERNEKFCILEVALLETSEWGRKLLSLTFQNITEKVRFTDELKNKNKELETLISKYQSTQLALQVTNEKLENALVAIEKANDELKKVDNMKDVFFSTITHELKTPISLIQGYMGILKNDMSIKSSAITIDILTAIERAVKRLVGLTEEIMELMRIKSGKLTLNSNLTYIGFIINPLIAEFGPLMDDKKMSIECRQIDKLPLVNVDTKKMETVFRNILINCIKFSKEGGRVYFAGEIIEELGKKFVKISITDEGCGVSKFNLDKIFSEFFTLAPPPNLIKETTIRGSGLGLSIAKGIAEAHGGKIWAESPGYDPETFPGTVFYVTIPVNE